MTKQWLTGLVVGVLAIGVPTAARADGAGYVGRCSMASVNDTTPGGPLGGPREWTAEVHLVAVDTTGPISAAGCAIKVSAGGTEGTIFDATVIGPVAVGAGQAAYTAESSDTVYICTRIIGAFGYLHECVPATTPVASSTSRS